MKFQKLFLFLFVCTLFVLPTAASAVDVTKQLGATAITGAGYEEAQELPLVIASGVRVFLSLLGIVFLVYTLYAGFVIMTARGEEDKMTEGKKTLTRAIIGVIVVMSAYSITLLAEKIATGDKKHQGDYIEIQDTDVDFQNTDQRHDVQRVGCPLGQKAQPDGTCGTYENEE